MSFPRYPEYKDSGVEWLGEVPAHWTLQKLKSIASFSGGGTPNRENLTYWNGDIPWVSPKDMKTERIVVAEESITERGLRSSASNLLPPGRVLMVVRSGILKHTIPVAINEMAVALNQDMKALNFDTDRCVGHFFLRWVQGLNDRLLLAWAKQGATVESIEHTYLANTLIPLPDAHDQTQIAAFLDRETAKIDELVAEQRRLMELLKEKRQAIISHAVTKGLNPDAPMKPSGIEWLGEVPAHWNAPKLKTLAQKQPASFTNGPFGSDLLTSELQEEGVPVIYIRDLKADGYCRSSTSYVTPEKADQLDKFRVDEQDILIAKVGDPPGFCCMYPEGEPPGIICQDVIRMKPNFELVSPNYLCTLLNSPPGIEAIDSICVQLTRKRFSLADLHSLRLPLPPRSEQVEIVQRLETIVGEFKALTAEAQRAINLLQERRTALISAAVTGQIDVRALAHPTIVEPTT